MENSKKWYDYWQIWVTVIGTVGGLFTYIYTQGANSKSLEGRSFDSAEQKVEHIYHVKSVPSPKKQREKVIFDSIQISEIKELLKVNLRDNADVKKHIHHLDSINALTADQIYQMTQEVKSIKSSRNNDN